MTTETEAEDKFTMIADLNARWSRAGRTLGERQRGIRAVLKGQMSTVAQKALERSAIDRMLDASTGEPT